MESTIKSPSTAPPVDVEELRSVATFADLPAEGLDWLASVMIVNEHERGELVFRAGDPVDHLSAVLQGEMRSERPDGRLFVAHAGDVTGLLPFSRLTNYPSDGYATEHLRLARLHKDQFPEMVRRIPELQARLVHAMSDRVRESAIADGQREKMMALGKLSAGLAHELNNPASAARRAADNLRTALESVRDAALKLDRDGLPLESRVYIAQLELSRAKFCPAHSMLGTLERSELEENIAAWLKSHKVRDEWTLASALVELGWNEDTLNQVSAHVPEQFLNDVLTRLTGSFTVSNLIDEIESSTARMSELVQAVKEYSYMDQMPEQEVDIHQGIENTLVMLKHRTKSGIEIIRDYDRTLAKVCVRGSELNQVWTNLIVNAIDAMEGKGTLTIRTSKDQAFACVEITDSGPGIPQEIQHRIFEPFFTTKPVGQGTGLGLDTAHRLVENHKGTTRFDSQPGRTRFTVRIPTCGVPAV